MDIVSTKSVAALLGVSEATVKRWSDAGVLRCFKTQGGHRKFRLRDVRAFLNADALPANAPPTAPASPLAPLVALEGDARRAEELALAGDVDGLLSLVAHASGEGRTYAETLERVLSPALRDIDDRWAGGALSSAEEHTASVAVVDMLARLRPFAESIGAKRGAERPRALCACLGEDRHDIAVRMSALALTERGYVVRTVGAHVPAVELAQLVGVEKPEIVALSASGSADQGALRSDLALLASAASAVKSRLVVGGAGFAKLAKMPSAVVRHEAIADLGGAS
jgi:excisionase family DNA binding protein